MIIAMTYAKAGVPYVDQSQRVARFGAGVSYPAEGYSVHGAESLYRFVRIEECGNWAVIVVPWGELLTMDPLDLFEQVLPIYDVADGRGNSFTGAQPLFGGESRIGRSAALSGAVARSLSPENSIFRPALPPQVTPPIASSPSPPHVVPLPPGILLLGTALAGMAGLSWQTRGRSCHRQRPVSR